jgi:hypothetical protein
MGFMDRLQKFFQTAGPEPSSSAAGAAAPAEGMAGGQETPAPSPAETEYFRLLDDYRHRRHQWLQARTTEADAGTLATCERASAEAYAGLARFCSIEGRDLDALDRAVADIDERWLVATLRDARAREYGVFVTGADDASAPTGERVRAQLAEFCVASGRDLAGLIDQAERELLEMFSGWAG